MITRTSLRPILLIVDRLMKLINKSITQKWSKIPPIHIHIHNQNNRVSIAVIYLNNDLTVMHYIPIIPFFCWEKYLMIWWVIFLLLSWQSSYNNQSCILTRQLHIALQGIQESCTMLYCNNTSSQDFVVVISRLLVYDMPGF